MTLAEFLVWEGQQPERYEFYRGETFAMAGGSARHNRVVLNLASRIGDHLDGTSCQVFATSTKVQIPDGVLYPNVLVTCAKADAGDERTVPNPRLIIEVLSPGAKGCDKRNKFILYRTMPSLREYVLIDPARRQVEVFTLAKDGAWWLTDQTQAGELTLSSIDCKLPIKSVFKGVSRRVHWNERPRAFLQLTFSPSEEITMTLPKERTRALRLAGELLKKVMRSKECPESIRIQAETVLRHYPDAWDIASQARRYDPQSAPFCWLGPEDNPSAGS